MEDKVFACDNCQVISSRNEAVWNKDGNRICLYCSPKDEIYSVCEWLRNNHEKYREIENRWELLDL